MYAHKSGLGFNKPWPPASPRPPPPTVSPHPVLTVVDYSGRSETLRAPVRAGLVVEDITVDEYYHHATSTLALSALLPLRLQLSHPSSNPPQHLARITKKLVGESQGHPLEGSANNERRGFVDLARERTLKSGDGAAGGTVKQYILP